MPTLQELTGRHAQAGTLVAIHVRPSRRAPLAALRRAELTETGLGGDHARPGKRAVTLMQVEHIPVIAALLGRPDVPPDIFRRNLLIGSINLSALRGRALRIGTALVEITGSCAPCSRMEEALGHGGYTAMRGHGGWCATVLSPGALALGDAVRPAEQDEGHTVR